MGKRSFQTVYWVRQNKEYFGEHGESHSKLSRENLHESIDFEELTDAKRFFDKLIKQAVKSFSVKDPEPAFVFHLFECEVVTETVGYYRDGKPRIKVTRNENPNNWISQVWVQNGLVIYSKKWSECEDFNWELILDGYYRVYLENKKDSPERYKGVSWEESPEYKDAWTEIESLQPDYSEKFLFDPEDDFKLDTSTNNDDEESDLKDYENLADEEY